MRLWFTKKIYFEQPRLSKKIFLHILVNKEEVVTEGNVDNRTNGLYISNERPEKVAKKKRVRDGMIT